MDEISKTTRRQITRAMKGKKRDEAVDVIKL